MDGQVVEKMMREATVERHLVRRAKQLGGMALKIEWIGRRGAPDRVVFLPGGVVWFVELKAPGKKPKPHQIREHNRLRALGVTVMVIDTKEQVDEVLGWK